MELLHSLLNGPEPRGKSFCSCAPSPPPTPDYSGAAKAQGQANVDAARVQGKLNNPTIIGPYGTQEVTYGGGFDQGAFDTATQQYNQAKAARDASWKQWDAGGRSGAWNVPEPVAPNRSDARFIKGDPDQVTVRQTLSPDQQKLLDKSNAAKIGMSDLAVQGTDLAKGVLGKSMDFNTLPAAPGSATDTRTKVMNAMMGRINEDSDRREGQLNSRLLSSGIPRGSQAYSDAMALEGRKRTDAENQAYLASGQEASRDFGMDSQRRQQALAEMLTQRQTPINEITALMSGSQVSNPFTTNGFAQNTSVQAAPLFAAQNMAADYNTDLYNAKAAQANGLQSGLFGLGGTGLMAGGMMMSDRRLKTNIQRIGTHPLGIGVYEYDIFGQRQQGVMADEVMTVKPEAVVMTPSGFYAVDYGRLA